MHVVAMHTSDYRGSTVDTGGLDVTFGAFGLIFCVKRSAKSVSNFRVRSFKLKVEVMFSHYFVPYSRSHNIP